MGGARLYISSSICILSLESLTQRCLAVGVGVWWGVVGCGRGGGGGEVEMEYMYFQVMRGNNYIRHAPDLILMHAWCSIASTV